MPACPTPTSTVIVSKNALGETLAPAAFSARASRLVRKCTRWAIACSPSGPWNTAYIEAMTARSAWAVQTFEVAFSRRICCSRVCSASR